MQRRQFLAAAAGAPLSSTTRPNIVLLLPDQLRAQSVGCLGNTDVRTPHIDRLAGEGALLRHTFANTPVCCPARANLLTGQYTHRNGMVANDLRLRESSVSLAKELSGAGYRTGFIGKWHLDGGQRLPGFVPPGPRRQGYQYWAANECSHDHFKNTIFRDTPDPITLTKFEADGYADYGVEFLRAASSDKRPFFLNVQWGPPHDPYKAPPEYSRTYDPAKLTMRPNYKAGPNVPGPREIAEYYAMTTAVDDAVGRILATLDELRLRDNTIVLLSSDHGDMLGSQGLRLKRKPWEESIRIPGIIRWPGRIPKARSDLFFTHVDFAPTLLGLAGLKPPDAMQGANLSDQVLTGSNKGPDSAFFQIFGPFEGDGTPGGWRGVRTARYMYATFRDTPWVLYDLDKDPFEQHNLINDPGARPILAEMQRRVDTWMRKTGDSWSYNWSHLVEDKGRLYKHQTFYTVDEYLTWAKQHPDLDAAK